MILVPYFNAMAYGLKRFTWVNAVTLAGQASYVVALLSLWLSGTLTPLAAVLSALGSQLIQCLLHLIHIKPSVAESGDFPVAPTVNVCDWEFVSRRQASPLLFCSMPIAPSSFAQRRLSR